MRTNIIGRCRVGRGLQVLLGLWLILVVCSLSELVLHETLLEPALMYDCETMIWKEKGRPRIRTEIDNLRGLQGIKRMDKVPNAPITEFSGVTKGDGRKD